MSQYYHPVHYHRGAHKHSFATALATLVSLLGGFVVLLLATRFVLSLMQVDRLQPFADFVYSLSYPLIAPFFALFNYQQQMGIMKIEFQTLFAIIFWSLTTWFIARSITNAVKEET